MDLCLKKECFVLIVVVVISLSFGLLTLSAGEEKNPMTLKKLTPAEERVILLKGTEPAFSGTLTDLEETGTYKCKRCESKLFPSSSKFHSGCGWPSFDDALKGAVVEKPDADGRRTEILCARCGGHLGHVFRGEAMTKKNTRHCVNSISMIFEKDNSEKASEKSERQTDVAYFAGGCFWGVEYYFEQEQGVYHAVSGYMGGQPKNPSYEAVSTGETGHAETVQVTFDPTKTNYETLAKLFFEIHDPTQINRQGPDHGPQYRSVVFVTSDKQKAVIEKLVGVLQQKGFNVQTEIRPAESFFAAQDSHQNYYERTGKTPYCHSRTQRF